MGGTSWTCPVACCTAATFDRRGWYVVRAADEIGDYCPFSGACAPTRRRSRPAKAFVLDSSGIIQLEHAGTRCVVWVETPRSRFYDRLCRQQTEFKGSPAKLRVGKEDRRHESADVLDAR